MLLIADASDSIHLSQEGQTEFLGKGKGKIQTYTDLFGLIQTLLGAFLGKRSGTGPRSGKVDPLCCTAYARLLAQQPVAAGQRGDHHADQLLEDWTQACM